MLPPLAVSDEEEPLQTGFDPAMTLMVVVFTVTVTVAALEQPLMLVPVIV